MIIWEKVKEKIEIGKIIQVAFDWSISSGMFSFPYSASLQRYFWNNYCATSLILIMQLAIKLIDELIYNFEIRN